MDATVIDLCARVFNWLHFRHTKWAVKRHLLRDYDVLLSCYAVITNSKQHEVRVARRGSMRRALCWC